MHHKIIDTGPPAARLACADARSILRCPASDCDNTQYMNLVSDGSDDLFQCEQCGEVAEVYFSHANGHLYLCVRPASTARRRAESRAAARSRSRSSAPAEKTRECGAVPPA